MQESAVPASNGRTRYRALIIDWGGVMTNPIVDTVRTWLDAEDIDYTHYADVMRPWVVAAYAESDRNPIHALERGECTIEEFEQELAARLVCRDGRPVVADGLLARMFAATAPCDPMYAAVYAVREAGVLTGLLSNSWGVGDYPRHLFPGMFDAVVISAEVGMRKPEERIFRHAAELLGLGPGDCVFVDDLEANVTAAEAIGMTGVLHREPDATVGRLGELFGLPLSSGVTGNGDAGRGNSGVGRGGSGAGSG
ncbi:MAG TPA: HAD family phosphatase [Streptosporangiaceae bacterium]|jgi:putative hydrolase of the HAD superfamily